MLLARVTLAAAVLGQGVTDTGDDTSTVLAVVLTLVVLTFAAGCLKFACS